MSETPINDEVEQTINDLRAALQLPADDPRRADAIVAAMADAYAAQANAITGSITALARLYEAKADASEEQITALDQRMARLAHDMRVLSQSVEAWKELVAQRIAEVLATLNEQLAQVGALHAQLADRIAQLEAVRGA